MGSYLKTLIERYRMVERRLPIFAKPRERKGRYYLRDNFLRAWLGCLANPVAAINFRPEAALVEQADERLHEAEGFGLERLVGHLYEERSRKDVGDLTNFEGHVGRFLAAHPRWGDWTVEKVAIAPVLDADTRNAIEDQGVVPQDLGDLLADLPR